ncbi:MAG: hypothetical protein AAB473_02415 [Patescibacteria group bacterium]
MPELERVSNILPRAETPATGGVESSVERETSVAPQQNEAAISAAVPVQQTAQRAAPSQVATDPRAKMLKDVEEILSDGLGDTYKALPKDRQLVFRQKGEEIANKITDMIIFGKAKAKEVWKLVMEWLGSLPGINKYFLEQEMKIKTDRVMMFAESAHQ